MTILFQDPLSGNNSNGGLTPGDAWATTQFSADSALAGDEVRMMNTAVESAPTQIDFDTNAGTRNDPIRFVGADGAGDPISVGYYTIQATASMSALIAPTLLANFVTFKNIDFDGNSNVTSHLINGSGVNEGIGWHFLRCMSHNAGGDGFNFRGSVGPQIVIADCDIFDNGGDGLSPNNGSTSRWGEFIVTGNRIHNNGGNGLNNFNAQNLSFIGNLIYSNAGDGIGNIAGTPGTPPAQIAQNVIFNNGGHGINIDALEDVFTIYNNIIRSNGGYGIKLPTTILDSLGWIDYNCYHNNTLGDSDQTLPGDFNVLANPLFTNEGVGTENFLLAPGSPCHLAGVHGGAMGIGSANDDTGGGGGGGQSRILNNGLLGRAY